MRNMDSNNTAQMKIESIIDEEKGKKHGCWARFKSLFEERGFDLEFEYNNTPVNILRENRDDTEGYRKLEGRNSISKKSDEIVNIDGELSGVINFYEQFATLNDDLPEEVIDTKRRSTIRHRVSMRPSMLLTNILEETGDMEIDNLQEVSHP